MITDPAPTALYRVGNDQVAWRQTGQEIVVLDLHGSVYFGLNPTGAALWKLLVDGATRARLADELVHLGVRDPARARRDVDEFLLALDAADLLRQA